MPVPHKTAFWRRVWQMTVGRGLQPLAHRVHTAHFTAIRFLGSVNAGATAGNITSHLERGTESTHHLRFLNLRPRVATLRMEDLIHAKSGLE